jgi:RND family efflux transporter MFP subunit
MVRIAVVLALVSGCSRIERPSAALPAGQDGVSANGVVEGARREVAVRPEVAGILAALHVREGQTVKAGDPLFELVNERQRAQLDLARAELEAHQVRAAHADNDYQRSSRLFGRGAVASEQYDNDRFRRSLAQAGVAEAKCRVALAEAELRRGRCLASADATILQVLVEPGAFVGPDAPQPVVRIVDLSRRRVRAFVEELDMARVGVGLPATVTADGLPGRSFRGRVASVSARMGKSGVATDAPDEYKDVYFREVLIDLEKTEELPVNLRVRVQLASADR